MTLYRPNVFSISLQAVADNTRQIRTALGPDRHFIATLKANAYGYGLQAVAPVVLEHGADALSLACAAEAVALREAGITVPIVLYAGTLPSQELVRAVEHYDLMPTLHNWRALRLFQEHLRTPITVAVKLDVGPERIGIPAEDAVAFVAAIDAHPLMQVGLVNAHPNIQGGPNAPEALQWQYARFTQALAALQAQGHQVPLRAMASSKVMRMTADRMLLNAADPGAALFSGLQTEPVLQRQAFHGLSSRLIDVRSVVRTEYLDEAPFAIQPGMRIGVIPFGYSDGVQHLHGGHVLVRGRQVPVIGAASLEYLRIDLTHVPDAEMGDEVVLIGAQGNQRIQAEDVMHYNKAARVIDMALRVGPQVRRQYV